MSTIQIIVLSVFLGVSMKIADLLNEHGLKWFRGSKFIFGVLWGGFGALLLLGPNALAMFWLAVFLSYIITAKIDYINHGIASIIILIVFFWNVDRILIDWPVFLYFFFAITLTGLFHKLVIKRYRIKKGIGKLFELKFSIFKWGIYYELIVLLFSIYTGIWIVFASRVFFWVSYDLATHYGMGKIKRYGQVWEK